MEHPAGFEPATSRLTDEVTAIFTSLRCAAAEAVLRSAYARRRTVDGVVQLRLAGHGSWEKDWWGTSDAVAALAGEMSYGISAGGP